MLLARESFSFAPINYLSGSSFDAISNLLSIGVFDYSEAIRRISTGLLGIKGWLSGFYFAALPPKLDFFSTATGTDDIVELCNATKFVLILVGDIIDYGWVYSLELTGFSAVSGSVWTL
jgi:hypothetical protein